MSKFEELKLDIEELDRLLQLAQRQRIKDALNIELRKLQTELSKHPDPSTETKKPSASSSNAATTKCYEVKLNNYGWDQSEKYVKIYLTLKNVHTLPEGAVYCNYTEKSVDIKALGLENRNYHLPIQNLCEEIDAAKSYVKVKTDMIIVFLAKKIIDKHWSHVTGVEKRIKEAKNAPIPSIDKEQDPESNIMNLMKKMYQDGDDDMKKIIAKAWTESQDKSKSSTSDFPSL